MAKSAFLISLLFLLLTIMITQGQGDHALAGGKNTWNLWSDIVH